MPETLAPNLATTAGPAPAEQAVTDQERYRRTFADMVGLDPALPLPEAADKVTKRAVEQSRNLRHWGTQNDMPSELDLALERYMPIPRPSEPFKAVDLEARPMAPNAPTGTFGSGFAEGFLKDTLLGNLIERQERKAQVERAMGPMVPQPGYDAFSDPQLAYPELRNQLWLFYDSQSPAETQYRIRQYLDRKWDAQSMANASGMSTFGRMLGGMADPTLFLTQELGLSAKVVAASRAAGHAPIWGRLARGIELGSINAAQLLGMEATRGHLDQSYMADGLGDAMALAGGIGMAVGILTKASGRMLHQNDRRAVSQWEGHGNYAQLAESAPSHPFMADQGYAMQSVGAHATPYMAASHYMQALEDEGLKSIFGMEKFGLTPMIRGLNSSSLLVRELTAQLVDFGGLKQNKNIDSATRRALATSFPTESEIAVRWKTRASEVEQGLRSDWLMARTGMAEELAKDMAPFLKEQLMSWLKKDGRLSFNDFDNRVGRAVANGNADLVKDAFTASVESSARRVDGLLKEHKAHALETGVFKNVWEKEIQKTRMELSATTKRGGEQRHIDQLEARLAKMEQLAQHGPQVNTGPNFFPRTHRHDLMAEREGEWLAIVERWFRRGGMSPDEAKAAAAAAHSEITLSNFRPIVEDNGALIKQAADPGSAKFRTLEIPDEDITEFLDWSAVAAVRRQTATMAPAIELTRRFGDATMSEALAEIQADFEKKIMASQSGTKRVELQNEMKQALEDVQALRDRLLNVAGASKDPHSWNERTIRMVKHYTAWTTLGLSAVSQLGDLFRPAITEGLDATHRYGFLTLIDASRAEIMKMSQRERMVAGDGMELATGSAALAFSNIGDTYHSRSALERHANQLSGAYFMLNGLTATTDLTKRAAGVIIQGNLNHEIMKWGELLEAEMKAAGRAAIEDTIKAGGIKHTADFDIFMTGNAIKDAEGKPVVVYHGTSRIFDEFMNEKLGGTTGSEASREGHFFASHPEATEMYAGSLNEKNERGSANVRPTYIRMTNPYEVGRGEVVPPKKTPEERRALLEMEFKPGELKQVPGMPGGSLAETIKLAKAGGHDGVIIRNTIEGNDVGTDVYIVFDPKTQIRGFDQRWDISDTDVAKWSGLEGTPAHEQMSKLASPSKAMLERLHSLSIDANDALAIYQMLKEHGVQFKSIRMANSDAWTDKEAQMLYRGAIGRALNRTVVTPGAGDRPTWMTTSVGSLIGQFKTFGVSSTIRTLYAGLQDNDRQFWTGMAVLTGAGIVLNELRNQLFYDKSTFNQPYLGILADGLDRSGALGSLMDVNNAVEVATQNKVGLRPLVGAPKNMPVTASKFAGTFFGPAAGKATDAARVLGEIVSGNADARTWRDMRPLVVPGHNIPYVDPFADMAFPKPAPRQKGQKKELVE